MQQFWDERYRHQAYAYGENPNAFLSAQLPKLKAGRALFPAEGEGRNAAYAAALGWEVDAFDYSKVARQKAEALFARKSVQVSYMHSGIEDYPFKKDYYDLVFLCYVHLPHDQLTLLHRQSCSALRRGGWLLLEGFHTDQLGRSSGGPNRKDMLFSLDGIEKDFSALSIHQLDKHIIQLQEGNYHQGEAAIVRMKAQKL